MRSAPELEVYLIIGKHIGGGSRHFLLSLLLVVILSEAKDLREAMNLFLE